MSVSHVLLPGWVREASAKLSYVGSYAVCPEIANDVDVACLVECRSEFIQTALKHGFRYNATFVADTASYDVVKRGSLELLVVDEPFMFERMVAITALEKRLKMTDSKDRVAMWQAAVFGRCE